MKDENGQELDMRDDTRFQNIAIDKKTAEAFPAKVIFRFHCPFLYKTISECIIQDITHWGVFYFQQNIMQLIKGSVYYVLQLN